MQIFNSTKATSRRTRLVVLLLYDIQLGLAGVGEEVFEDPVVSEELILHESMRG